MRGILELTVNRADLKSPILVGIDDGMCTKDMEMEEEFLEAYEEGQDKIIALLVMEGYEKFASMSTTILSLKAKGYEVTFDYFEEGVKASNRLLSMCKPRLIHNILKPYDFDEAYARVVKESDGVDRAEALVNASDAIMDAFDEVIIASEKDL